MSRPFFAEVKVQNATTSKRRVSRAESRLSKLRQGEDNFGFKFSTVIFSHRPPFLVANCASLYHLFCRLATGSNSRAHLSLPNISFATLNPNVYLITDSRRDRQSEWKSWITYHITIQFGSIPLWVTKVHLIMKKNKAAWRFNLWCPFLLDHYRVLSN